MKTCLYSRLGQHNNSTLHKTNYITYAPARKLSTNLYDIYEGWNFNSGNYLFTTDTK